MKEFSTAARTADKDEADVLEFKVDDQEIRAYPPTPGQLAVMYSMLANNKTDQDRIAGIIDFFFGLLDSDSAMALERRLMDRTDSFELAQIEEIMSWLVEEWSGRPTLSSSGSTPSRRPTGRKSTAVSRSAASTRGTTPLIASAT